MKNYTLTAHTGNEGTKDNSLDSIRSAASNGADIVEFDVLFRRNGTPVMRHSKPIPPRCPTVEEGLNEVAGTQLLINLDIKDPDHVDSVIALADKIGIKDRCFFTGIYEDWVGKIKAQCPDVKYYLNTDVDEKLCTDDAYIASLVDKVKSCGAAGLNCHYGNMNEKIVAAFHAASLEVSVWTVNNLEDYRRIAAMGVDNITTRHPSFEKQK